MDGGVGETTADEAFGVEDGVLGVHGDLVFGGVADEAFGVSECHVGWGGAVALVVGDDLDAVVLPYAHAAVCRSEIDAYGFAFFCRHGGWLRFELQVSNFLN